MDSSVSSTGAQTPDARKSWRVAYGVLTAAFLCAAALNMLHVRGGFLTNHLADLAVPAWLYVVFRGLAGHRSNVLSRWIGATPERTAILLFVASTVTEVSQRWWPRGVFAGRFDPLDLVAYGASLLACYAADLRSRRPLIMMAVLAIALTGGSAAATTRDVVIDTDVGNDDLMAIRCSFHP